MEHTDFDARFKKALQTIGSLPPAPPEDPPHDPDVGYETLQDYTGVVRKPRQKLTTINIFQHPDAHPVVLDLCLLKKYGPDWLEWETETLRWRIPQDFRTSSSSKESSVSDLNMGKVQASKVLHFNDTYWQRWEVFNWCTQPFNYQYADFETMSPPSAAQILVSIDTAGHIRSDVQWSDEVKDFMRTACKFEGVHCPPEPLDFIEVGTDHGLLDCEEVKSRWPEVRKADKLLPITSAEDEQLNRNLMAHRYLTRNRERLQGQMPLVLHV